MNNQQKWDLRFVKLAEEVAKWSKDPSTQVGAIAVNRIGSVVAQGYNGFPRGIEDKDLRYQDRELKYQYVVHAEMNVIYNASLNGVSLFGSTMYVYGLPVCSDCAKGIIQSGISHVIMNDQEIPEDWKESADLTFDMFTEAGVEYTFADIEEPIEVKPVYKNNIIEMPKNENEDKNKT